MIDSAMLSRLMVQTGFAPPEISMPQATKEMLALARAIWTEAQKDEREECAKLADGHFIFGHSVAGPHFAAVLANKIRMRANAEVRGD